MSEDSWAPIDHQLLDAEAIRIKAELIKAVDDPRHRR